MPVSVNDIARTPVSWAWLGAREGRYVTRGRNNLGQVDYMTSGLASTKLGWRAATPSPATVTANTWVQTSVGIVRPTIGRVIVLYRAEIEVTGACDIALLTWRDWRQTLDSSLTGSLSPLDQVNAVRVGSMTGAGKLVFEWPEGFVVHSGMRTDLYLSVPGSGSVSFVNWQMDTYGYDLTNDFDFDAQKTLCVIGDSISGVTADTGAVQYCERESGAITGLWPFIIKAKLQKLGTRVRVNNRAFGGGSSAHWDALISQGQLDHLRGDALCVNIGMNDAASDNTISTTAGTDGGYKQAVKRIARHWFERNPRTVCVFNQITATDSSARTANVASGIYAGTPRLTAYRAELTAAVAEIVAANPTWDVRIAATDTAYSASTSAAFLSTESSAGSRVHPNDTVGQPAMADLIWTALQDSSLVPA